MGQQPELSRKEGSFGVDKLEGVVCSNVEHVPYSVCPRASLASLEYIPILSSKPRVDRRKTNIISFSRNASIKKRVSRTAEKGYRPRTAKPPNAMNLDREDQTTQKDAKTLLNFRDNHLPT